MLKATALSTLKWCISCCVDLASIFFHKSAKKLEKSYLKLHVKSQDGAGLPAAPLCRRGPHVSQAGGRRDTWKEAFSSALYFKHHKMPPGTPVGTNTPCSSFFFRTERPLCSLPSKSQVIFLFLVETLSGTKDSITTGFVDSPEGRTRAVVAGLVVLGVAVVAAAAGWMCRSRCPRHGTYTGTGRVGGVRLVGVSVPAFLKMLKCSAESVSFDVWF